MTEYDLKKAKRLPEALQASALHFLQKALPVLPCDPAVETWYSFYPEQAVCGNGEPYHGCLRIGTENKLCILFSGGGVSVNAYTAANPENLFRPQSAGFYSNDVFLVADLFAYMGIGKAFDGNPLNHWTVLYVPYASGDFHIGDNDYAYTDENGEQKVLYHHGYRNYRALLNQIKSIIPEPEQLLIAGYSAGGFAAALLAQDVRREFPSCRDVTCCIDSALMPYDQWHEVASEVWRAPQEITDRLNSNNTTVDSLISLHKNDPDVKIMFACSVRDTDLSKYLNYLQNGALVKTKEAGKLFEQELREMVARLEKNIPEIAWFLFDTPDPANRALALTQHTILNALNIHDVKADGLTVYEWLNAGLNNRPLKLGVRLLSNEQ